MPKTAGMRDTIRAQVARCAYVERIDTERSAGDSGNNAPSDSFRKLQWLRQRALRTNSLQTQQQQLSDQDEHAAADNDALRVQQQQQQLALELQRAAADITQRQTETTQLQERLLADKRKRDASVPLAFETFLDKIQAGNVDVSCSSSPLPATPFDRLGAISVPSRREGNSLTLCCWTDTPDPAATATTRSTSATTAESQGISNSDDKQVRSVRNEQLVVFGGRVLQDIAMLLPAAVQKDPMLFERVRYTYSNAVYTYDIATRVWRFRDCSGRVPCARSDHSAVFVKPHLLVVVGGRGRNGQLFRDTNVLDLVTWRWIRVDTDSTQLLERYWHASCVVSDNVFVFGGKSEVLAHGDLQQLNVSALLIAVTTEADELQSRSVTEATSVKLRRSPLSWKCPHTVGKAPSPRFGMVLLALDDERIAVVGGYRPHTKQRMGHAALRTQRLMDVHILDTVMMIWSTPRLSAHVSTLTAPTERMLFECFYTHSTIVVFGGFTYATNGETETYTACRDDTHVVYKLDVNRMIWRRQDLIATDAMRDGKSRWLPTAHAHTSANALLGDQAFTCAVSDTHSLLDLAAFHVSQTVLSPLLSEKAVLASSAVDAEVEEVAVSGD